MLSLIHIFGGKDVIYYLVGTITDTFRPFAEAISIPFEVLLVGNRHMLGNCAVLSLSPIKPAMGCDTVVIVKNLNGLICNPHIDFALYIFMRN